MRVQSEDGFFDFIFSSSRGKYGEDGVNIISRRIEQRQLERALSLKVDSGPTLRAFLHLVMVALQADDENQCEITIDMQELKPDYPKVLISILGKPLTSTLDNPLQLKELLVPTSPSVAASEKTDDSEDLFVVTAAPRLHVALAMAAHCQTWKLNYPRNKETLDYWGEQFDVHAAALLDQCNTSAEAEQILNHWIDDSFDHNDQGLRDQGSMSMCPCFGPKDESLDGAANSARTGWLPYRVLGFALRYSLRNFASNRWLQLHVDTLWTSPDVQFLVGQRCTKDGSSTADTADTSVGDTHKTENKAVETVSRWLISIDRSTNVLLNAAVVPALCIATPLAAIATFVLSTVAMCAPKTFFSFLFLSLSLDQTVKIEICPMRFA